MVALVVRILSVCLLTVVGCRSSVKSEKDVLIDQDCAHDAVAADTQEVKKRDSGESLDVGASCGLDRTKCVDGSVWVCSDAGGWTFSQECDEGGDCMDGSCVCLSDCSGNECGDDGCGGSCGKCGTGRACIAGKCPPEGMQCDDGNDVPWDGCTGGVITEFQVNEWTAGYQHRPTVAAVGNSGFAVAWQSCPLPEGPAGEEDCFWVPEEGQDGVGCGIYARLLLVGEVAGAGEFQVNETHNGDQERPMVTALPGGHVYFGWTQKDRYYPDYLDHCSGIPHWLASFSCGERLSARTISGFGQADSGEVKISGPGMITVRHGASAPASDASFVAVWEAGMAGSPEVRLYGRLNDVTGKPLGELFDVDTVSGAAYVGWRFPSVAYVSQPAIVVVWESPGGAGILARLFSTDGLALGEPFEVDSLTESKALLPDVAGVAGGGFVVAWGTFDLDGDGQGVFARRFGPDGTPEGDQFQVNTEWEGVQSQAAVAAFASGRWIVVWNTWPDPGSDPYTGSTYDVHGQLFNSDGTKQGSEFVVNSFQTGTQGSPDVVAFSDGSFVVVWASKEQDGAGRDVFAQRFNADASRTYR